MFVASIPKNDVEKLAGEGCVVTINGKPETVRRNGDCLCWREDVRPILEEFSNGSSVTFVCGEQEGGEYYLIDPLQTRKYVLPEKASDDQLNACSSQKQAHRNNNQEMTKAAMGSECKPDLVIADEAHHATPHPDVIVCDEANHENARAGRKVLQSWPEFAAEIFPKLQAEYPELRGVTLQEFIAECPYKIEFVG